jgi:hypothetical protein
LERLTTAAGSSEKRPFCQAVVVVAAEAFGSPPATKSEAATRVTVEMRATHPSDFTVSPLAQRCAQLDTDGSRDNRRQPAAGAEADRS